MIFFYRVLFLIVTILSTITVSAQSNIDVLHYKFGLILNDRNDNIEGSAILKIKFLQPASSFTLDLASLDGQGKGMKVNNVTANKGFAVKGFSAENDNLKISLKEPAKTNDSCFLTITYHGIPRDGLIISKNKYGDRTFFADNWPNRAHNWIPCKDEPGDKASFEFLVTAPSYYRVISNGILQEEKILPDKRKLTHWKEDVPLSTKVMVIGLAKFAVKQYDDSPPNIPISAWVYPQDSALGFKNYSPAPAIVKFYSRYIAPYPYNKLANVQSKTIFGGMENASAIFYYEESATVKKSVEDLLAHEIAHQWFGDMASEKSFAHLWLSEGFATYFTDIYFGSKYGMDSMNRRLKTERNEVVEFVKTSTRPVVDSVSSYMQLLNANSYQKGAWVLHMLHSQMGDTAFHRFIRIYYDRFKGKNADTEDLRAVAEEVSHKNLHAFFRQWLYSPGIPQLNVQWKYDEKDKSVSITVIQEQKQGIFEFPLKVQLQFANSKTDQVEILNISGQTETFKFQVKDIISDISLDPDTSLLFEGKTQKLN